MPEETVQLYLDHGSVVPISEADLVAAESAFESLAECGIDIADVASVLETEGIASFAASFDDLLAKLQDKADALGTLR
jgi:transaldolase